MTTLPSTTPIQVDIHELPSGIPSQLAERYPTIVLEMPVGDYGFVDIAGNCILVERKSASDLLSSITDGRLKSQITRIQVADAPFLLIEGELRNHDGDTDYCYQVRDSRSPHSRLHLYRHSGYDYPYVLSLLLRTLYLSPVRILWVQDKEGTLQMLSALYRSTLRYSINSVGDDT